VLSKNNLIILNYIVLKKIDHKEAYEHRLNYV